MSAYVGAGTEQSVSFAPGDSVTTLDLEFPTGLRKNDWFGIAIVWRETFTGFSIDSTGATVAASALSQFGVFTKIIVPGPAPLLQPEQTINSETLWGKYNGTDTTTPLELHPGSGTGYSFTNFVARTVGYRGLAGIAPVGFAGFDFADGGGVAPYCIASPVSDLLYGFRDELGDVDGTLNCPAGVVVMLSASDDATPSLDTANSHTLRFSGGSTSDGTAYSWSDRTLTVPTFAPTATWDVGTNAVTWCALLNLSAAGGWTVGSIPIGPRSRGWQ